jgi:isoleucyl-tRNA synthetase
VRALATKALEEARDAKQLTKSLEAALTVRGPAAALAPLREHEAQSTVFPGNLASLFIVSAVHLEEADGPLEVTVGLAPGRKCGRCWTLSEKVGTLDEAEVCERCAEVLVHQ